MKELEDRFLFQSRPILSFYYEQKQDLDDPQLSVSAWFE